MASSVAASFSELRPFRRQFAITDSGLSGFSAWKSVRLLCGLVVQAHADLCVTQVDSPGRRLTLLGYILDPDTPDATDAEILRNLCAQAVSASKVTELTSRMGGRWVLIAEVAADAILFHDACGLRQVHYSQVGISPRFCASQPVSVAAELGLERDAVLERDFATSEYARRDHEYWWPNDSTPYRGVRCLLPNHMLDLHRRTAERYWPKKARSRLPLMEAAAKGAKQLRALTLAASRRFRLSLPLTAGRDSRALLAAARDIAKEIHFFTLEIPNVTVNRTDRTVARRLLKSLNLEHHTIPAMRSMDPRFREAYYASVEPAHESAALLAAALWRDHPAERAALMGHCSEIGRNYYRFGGASDIEDLEHVIAKVQMTGNDFAAGQLAAWLDDCCPAVDLGYDLWDMLYWEQRDGRWAANGQAQWDLVHESVTPFDCRELLETLMSVDSSDRGSPTFRLHEEMIRVLWPEVLSAPLNPGPSRVDLLRALLTETRKNPAHTWRRAGRWAKRQIGRY